MNATFRFIYRSSQHFRFIERKRVTFSFINRRRETFSLYRKSTQLSVLSIDGMQHFALSVESDSLGLFILRIVLVLELVLVLNV
jgi:hypothetical protein